MAGFIGHGTLLLTTKTGCRLPALTESKAQRRGLEIWGETPLLADIKVSLKGKIGTVID